MKNKTYNILVLADIDNNLTSLLNNAFSMAKKIGGTINLFYVKPAVKVVENSNQLSAMRTLNREQMKLKKKLNEQLHQFVEKTGIEAKTSFAIGNTREEIKKSLSNQKPDLVMIGKPKINPLRFIGDNITDLVLEEFNGPVFIAAETKAFDNESQLSLGILNGKKDTLNVAFGEHILNDLNSDIKTFQIGNDLEVENSGTQSFKKGTFVFDNNESALSNLPHYVEKSNINLLCVQRSNLGKKGINKDLKRIVKRVNVPVLLSN